MLIQNQPFCVVFTLMFKQDFIQNTDCQTPNKTKQKESSNLYRQQITKWLNGAGSLVFSTDNVKTEALV